MSEMGTSNSSENKGKNIALIVMGIVIALLLGLVIYFIVDSFSDDPELVSALDKIENMEEAKQELDSLYAYATTELETFRMENETLQGQISEKEAELSKAYARINRLIAQGQRGQASAAKLEEVKEELKRLQTLVDEQNVELDRLRAENEQLRTDKENLEGEVERTSEELQQVSIEKQDLSNQNEILSEKVDIASVLKVSGLKATGIKIRRNGNEKEISSARRSEKVKVCFEIIPNEVIESGLNKFYIQIEDPTGAILQQSNYGSGTIELQSGDSEKYTLMKSFSYAKNITSLCVDWKQDADFQKGEYTVRVYNHGHLSGKGTFSLR